MLGSQNLLTAVITSTKTHYGQSNRRLKEQWLPECRTFGFCTLKSRCDAKESLGIRKAGLSEKVMTIKLHSTTRSCPPQDFPLLHKPLYKSQKVAL